MSAIHAVVMPARHHRILPLRSLAAVVVMVLLAASCGGDTESTTTPALVVPTVSGGQFDFGDHAGRDLVLWFWAPW